MEFFMSDKYGDCLPNECGIIVLWEREGETETSGSRDASRGAERAVTQLAPFLFPAFHSYFLISSLLYSTLKMT